jgi:hypothetical protein
MSATYSPRVLPISLWQMTSSGSKVSRGSLRIRPSCRAFCLDLTMARPDVCRADPQTSCSRPPLRKLLLHVRLVGVEVGVVQHPNARGTGGHAARDCATKPQRMKGHVGATRSPRPARSSKVHRTHEARCGLMALANALPSESAEPTQGRPAWAEFPLAGRHARTSFTTERKSTRWNRPSQPRSHQKSSFAIDARSMADERSKCRQIGLD